MENCIFQLVIINKEEMKIFACQKQYPHYSAQKGWYYCIFQFKKIKFFSVQDYVFCIGWLTMAGSLADCCIPSCPYCSLSFVSFHQAESFFHIAPTSLRLAPQLH